MRLKYRRRCSTHGEKASRESSAAFLMGFDLNHIADNASDDLQLLGDNKRIFAWNMAEIRLYMLHR